MAAGLLAQAPTASPPTSTPVTTATASPASTAATISPILTPESDIEESIRKKLKKHFNVGTGGRETEADHEKSDEHIPAIAIPIVAIVFLSIFGAPVLIVIMIGVFALIISRSRQRTIRMMVEKGQPVPAELLAPHTRAVRQRSDVRRGVIWTMIGLGAMIFLGAVNDWEGGAWSIGLIPFLIGLGYLIVWKLETKKDNPPPAT
jgi:Domain of unknown function (DUF6249)